MNMLKFPRTTRRDFLVHGSKALSLLAFSSVAPSFLTRSAFARVPPPERDRRILVLIQLAGGNDGLNTVVPYADSRYHNLRPSLALGEKEVLPLSDGLGLHPAMGGIRELVEDGKFSILQGVGYPNPNRSHFRSMEIWETASDSDRFLSTGWVGRYFDNTCEGAPDADPTAVHFGDQVPVSLQGEDHHSLFAFSRRGRGADADPELLRSLAESGKNGGGALHFLNHTLLDALVAEERFGNVIREYRPLSEYPGTALARSLQNIASLIAAGTSTRLYFTSIGGFDTHINQAGRHAQLLTQLSDAMGAFQKDLEAHGLDDQVLTMTFSEFGRRPNENGSAGTDHGTSAPLFVMGKSVDQTLLGEMPNLDMAQTGDIPYSIDFRQVYATVIDQWLESTSENILGQQFSPIPFLKT